MTLLPSTNRRDRRAPDVPHAPPTQCAFRRHRLVDEKSVIHSTSGVRNVFVLREPHETRAFQCPGTIPETTFHPKGLAKRYQPRLCLRPFSEEWSMSKVTVLVVDDASFIRDLVKKGLRDHFPGIQIEEAINGRKAQQMLARSAVDLILCDWEMPEMSGLELLTWCRSQDTLKTTPFVMVTSRGDKENVVQAIQAGVSAYIVEGIHAQRLQPILDVAMARFESDQALRAQLNAREQQLAERKRVELAKGLLMKMKNCNEEDAYTLMRRQAMSRQQKLIQVAEQIIAMHDMLGH
eukprot:gene45082-55149_t